MSPLSPINEKGNDMEILRFYVPGKPIPQGSKRWLPNHRMVEANKDLRPWRATVTSYALQARHAQQHTTYEGPVLLNLHFTFARPKAHYRTGKHAGLLKTNAPVYMTNTPDVDKLARSIADAITDARVWRDDSQIAVMTAVKMYGEQPGVTVEVQPLVAT